MKEIGSEFWNATPRKDETEFLISGRTALEFIISDILTAGKYASVLMPSYLCDSMIEPFLHHSIAVRFYEVYYDEKCGLCVDMPKYRENEIFYHMSYFGFGELGNLDFKEIRTHYRAIISDTTHSCFSRMFCLGDYSYASLRKWTGFDGIAVATKYGGTFTVEKPQKKHDKYIETRRVAKELKRDYIEGKHNDKQTFLSLFAKAEKMLETDYVGYAASEDGYRQFYNLDVKRMCRARCTNAKILYERLGGISQIKLIFPSVDTNAVPLFVPVLAEQRDALRCYLTEHGVYCPVHWPLSDMHKISDAAKALYTKILSVVCDQRYTKEDMNRIADLIEAFYQQ